MSRKRYRGDLRTEPPLTLPSPLRGEGFGGSHAQVVLLHEDSLDQGRADVDRLSLDAIALERVGVDGRPKTAELVRAFAPLGGPGIGRARARLTCRWRSGRIGAMATMGVSSK